MCENELNSPKTFSSHSTTAITTTAFRIDLIVPCIGMKRLISHSTTPTTIRTMTICINGMSLGPPGSAGGIDVTQASVRASIGAHHTRKGGGNCGGIRYRSLHK